MCAAAAAAEPEKAFLCFPHFYVKFYCLLFSLIFQEKGCITRRYHSPNVSSCLIVSLGLGLQLCGCKLSPTFDITFTSLIHVQATRKAKKQKWKINEELRESY